MDAEQNAAVLTLTYMVRALLAMPKHRREGIVGNAAPPWSELLEQVTRSMKPEFGSVVVPLLSELSKRSGGMTVGQRELVGLAARRLLDFAWRIEGAPLGMVLSALEAICRTFESDRAESERLIRRCLDSSHLAEHGYKELPHLVEELEPIIPIAPALIEDVYRAALAYEETSDEPVEMGHSAIMSLTSNRRQDYMLALVLLGDMFASFAAQAPVHATGAVLAGVENEIRKRDSGRIEDLPSQEIWVGDAAARLTPDLSYVWDDEIHRGSEAHLRMLQGFEEMLVRLASGTEHIEVLRQVLSRVIREGHFAAVWRRVLLAAARAPATLGREIRSLVWSYPILTCPDTREPAGHFLRIVYPLLVQPERELVEEAVLAIPQKADPDRLKTAEHCRDVLLGCLDRGRLVTGAAKARLAELQETGGAPKNEPLFQTRRGTSLRTSSWSWLSDRGVPIRRKANRTLLKLAEEVSAGSRQFLNGDPEREQIRRLMPALNSLHQELARRLVDAHPLVLEEAWNVLAQACSIVARSSWLLEEAEITRKVREILLDASTNDAPAVDPERDAGYEESGAIRSGPRYHAAEGICRLGARSSLVDDPLLEAIERLAGDSVPAVRAEIAYGLVYLTRTAEAFAIEIFCEFCRIEGNRRVFNRALISMQRLVRSRPDELKPLIVQAFERAGVGNAADKIRRTCLSYCLILEREGSDPFAGTLIRRVVNEPFRHVDATIHLVQTAADYVLGYAPGSVNEAPSSFRVHSIRVLESIARAVRDEIRLLEIEWSRNPEWTDERRLRVEQTRKIARELGMRLQFATEGRRRTATAANGSSPTDEGRGARLLEEGAGLLDALQSVPFPEVIHALLETYKELVHASPADVLRRIAAAVRAGTNGAYQHESLGVGLTVKLVRRYLADSPRLLQEDRECREALMFILDTFVKAGWPEALELTFRLDEVFR